MRQYNKFNKIKNKKNLSNYSKVLTAVKASIANYECYNKEHRGLNYSLRYTVWNILLAVLSPHLRVNSDRMVCATTPLNEKQLKQYAKKGEYYCFSRTNNTILAMKKNRSVLSPYGRITRFKILWKGLCFYFTYINELKGYAHFTCEYYTIAQFLFDFSPSEIYSANSFERYCTLLSYLGHSLGIRLIGIQDGAIIDIHPPAKLFCDEMHIFDKYEQDVIQGIMADDKCKFICDGFSSTLTWKELPENGKKWIAIASQDNLTDRTNKLVNHIVTGLNHEKYNIIIYPHYRETSDQFNNIKCNNPDIRIESFIRHKNINFLITYYSTVVYDFWSVNPDLIVFCLHIPGNEPSYYQRANVNVCESESELIERLKTIL